MVTPVKTRMALFWESDTMASSFCSIDRSWKSWETIKSVTRVKEQTNLQHSWTASSLTKAGRWNHAAL